MSAWWTTTEATIQLLDDLFSGMIYNGTKFTTSHIRPFGPVVLGVRGWWQLDVSTICDWHSLRAQVELAFGLSESQLLELFYAMMMKEGETTAHFVIRVEQARRAVKAIEASTFHTFVQKLDASI